MKILLWLMLLVASGGAAVIQDKDTVSLCCIILAICIAAFSIIEAIENQDTKK